MTTVKVFLCTVLALAAVGCSEGNVFSLEVGSCFDDASDNEQQEVVSDVPIVDCDEPHDNEVFFTYDLPEGDYPGAEALNLSAEERCVGAFADYVGADYQSSSLDVSWLSPTTESWDRDDREITCILFDGQLAKLTGSVAGSGL